MPQSLPEISGNSRRRHTQAPPQSPGRAASPQNKHREAPFPPRFHFSTSREPVGEFGVCGPFFFQRQLTERPASHRLGLVCPSPSDESEPLPPTRAFLRCGHSPPFGVPSNLWATLGSDPPIPPRLTAVRASKQAPMAGPRWFSFPKQPFRLPVSAQDSGFSSAPAAAARRNLLGKQDPASPPSAQ